MEDELAEEMAAKLEEEIAANRQVQERMLEALGQLNKRLEKLEEQQSVASSADGSFIPVDSSQSGRAKD